MLRVRLSRLVQAPATLLLAVSALVAPAAAQSRIPPFDLVRLATCLEAQMGDALSDPTVTIDEGPAGNWRLALALRAQPGADQGVQSPAPSQPTTSYIDLAAVASARDLPADLDPFGNWAMLSDRKSVV